MPPQTLTDKPKIAVEPPAQPYVVLCLGPPKPEHHYQHAAGQAYEADCDAAHCSIQLMNQCVCYNSSLDAGLSESVHDCMNKPPVQPQPSEEVLRLAVFPSQLVIHLEQEELPIE